MAESSMKRQKAAVVEENDGGGSDETDKFSTLPNSVLCHILSLPPIKTAISMSLVSRRWRHLWKHRQVFYFYDDSHEYVPKTFTKFAFFVNAVLALRRSRDIREFSLFCGIMDDDTFRRDCVDIWINAAIGPRLEELSIGISGAYATYCVHLPSSLLNCTNLVHLSLVGAIQMNVEHCSVHFPSLKCLILDMDIMDSDIAFLSGCPALETLAIYFDPRSLTKVPVPPSSKRLKFNGGNFSWTYLEMCSDICWPDSVEYVVNRITLGIIGNVQSMVEAYLDVFSRCESKFVDPILNRLRNPDRDVYPLLHHSKSKWPLHVPVINNPEFCNLLHLKFILPCFNSNLLINVLDKCHMLQVLIIQSDKEEPSPLRPSEL
ncbi:FBD-associated F-box protein [Trifolium repens]|nr:FBD-associated F-box protein [Trifolium repens]